MKTHPAHRYIEFMLAIGMSDDEVVHMLVKDGFPVMDPAELARARYELDLPEGFDRNDPGQEPWATWVRAHGLSGAFRGTDAAVDAFRLLRSPARLVIEVLLLGGMTAASISEFLARNKAGDWSPEAVGRFASMFFATTEVGGGELVEFARRAPNGEAYRELMARGSDAAVELAERLLQRTATWPWARRAFEATAHADCSVPSATPLASAPAEVHPTRTLRRQCGQPTIPSTSE